MFWPFKFFCSPKKGKSHYITDSQGRIVIYHGVNVSNAAKHRGKPSGFFNAGSADISWHTKEDYQKLNEWGFNIVRLLVFWEALEPVKGQYDQEYINKVRQHLQWLKELNIDVLIDFHQDLFSQKFSGNGFPLWAVNDNNKSFELKEPWDLNYLQPAVLESFGNFWKSDEMHKLYAQAILTLLDNTKDFDNIVAVDIINEPFPKLFFLKYERTYITQFYEKMQAAIRPKYPNLLLFFEPWMSTSTGVPTALHYKPDPKNVFAPHYYDFWCMANKPYKKFNSWVLKRAVEIKVREAQLFKCPVIFGEFGFPPKALNWVRGIKDFLTQTDKHTTGWIYWVYDYTVYSEMGLFDHCKKPTEVLNSLVRIYPQRIAGKNPSYLLTDRSFILCYDLSDPSGCTLSCNTLDASGFTLNYNSSLTEIFIPDNVEITVEAGAENCSYDSATRRLSYKNDPSRNRQVISLTYTLK